jgi:transcriptional regulator with XRE-family HTH domain
MRKMSTLAERIEEIMRSNGLSIPEVAEMCDCSYQAVKKWLTGATMSIEGAHLVKLAKKTGYEAEWIMMGTGPKHRSYAKNELQAEALCVMETLPEAEQYKIRAVIDVISGAKH